jgi:hypothetical protein
MLGESCTRDPNARQKKRKHSAKLAPRTHSLNFSIFAPLDGEAPKSQKHSIRLSHKGKFRDSSQTCDLVQT